MAKSNFQKVYEQDIYTGSGSVDLYNCWTEDVNKHDTSSFYNWEQDNVPLYDLEERTFLNWEKLGYPTSSVPGLALVVSADAGATALGCNRSVFLSLSSCMDALPKFIDFPVLIEVASYGALGRLDLDNIVFGGSGSLEIINRNSYRGYSSFLSGLETTGLRGESGSNGIGSTYTETTFNSGFLATGTFSKYGGYQGVRDIAATAFPEWGLKQQFNGASAVSIGALVVTGTAGAGGADLAIPDHRFTGNTNMIVAGPGKNSLNWGLTVSINGNGPDLDSNAITGTPYENVGDNYNEINPFDSSSYSQLLGQSDGANKRPFRDLLSTNSRVYGNYLSSITVKNCAGPLYIRGFMVNGGREDKDGVTIENSTAVLEGCASVRNNGNGFLIKNSDVTFTRGVTAYRNYLLSGATLGRLDGHWSGIVGGGVDYKFKDETAGIKAIDSVVTVSSTSAFEFANYQAVGGATAVSSVLPVNDMNQFSRNTNGIYLINSVLQGGVEQTPTKATHGAGVKDPLLTKTYIISDSNTNNGWLAKESTINLKGKIEGFNNLRGMDLDSTDATLDEFTFVGNLREGIRAKKSSIQYNSSFQKINDTNFMDNAFGTQWFLSGNGNHITLDDSNFEPVYGASMDANYGTMRFLNSHGIDYASTGQGAPAARDTGSVIPAVRAMNGSKVELVHSDMRRNQDDVGAEDEPSYGSLVCVEGGSEAIFRGTKTYATRLLGPVAYGKQKYAAGVYATDGSKVEFTGPTVIAQFGVDVLADNNSVMGFNPPRDKQRGSIDASSWNLFDGANHTHVELHSTRACLVADRGSVINMEDLGDFKKQWARQAALGAAAAGTLANLSGADYDTGFKNLTFLTSAGSIQFYPNPNDEGDYPGGLGNESKVGCNSVTGTVTNGWASQNAFTATRLFGYAAGQTNTYYQYLGGDQDAGPWEQDSHGDGGVSAMTGGGVCLRAVHGSKVNVNNVHFPTGWWNPSGIYYDSQVAGGADDSRLLCEKLFIWNIADNSELHASYTSVSGHYPADVGYFGPSCVWATESLAGTGAPTIAPNPVGFPCEYGAPSGTPDTSSLSVLDYFGKGPVAAAGNATSLILPAPNQGCVGTVGFGFGESPQNQGPFRLFLSPDPIVNHLQQNQGPVTAVKGAHTNIGLAHQVYSQGYQMSGNLECSSNLSATYGSIVRWNVAPSAPGRYGEEVPVTGSLHTTGTFYYASAMLDNNGSCRIFLDESAANTFANAKHLSVGKSGLAKMVQIYGPYTAAMGDSAINSNKQYGRGYKSSGQFDLGKAN